MTTSNNHQLVSTPGTVLFLLSHCDDEFFVIPRIEKEIKIGSDVYVAFTTDGTAYDASSETRLNESLSVLTQSGVTTANVRALGTKLGVKDGLSFDSIEVLWNGLEQEFKNVIFDRIYTMAWEGGHADHDVTHLLAIAYRKRSPKTLVFEFSAYQSKGIPGPFFRCMSLIPNKWPLLTDRVSWQKSVAWFLTTRAYRTQVKTFIGLSPFFAFQVLGKRSSICRLVDSHDYLAPPHSGALMYEKRFKVPFSKFKQATSEFVRKNIL